MFDENELAKRIADRLFTNGAGGKAERLVLELPGKRYGGGWCRKAVEDQIADAIEELTQALTADRDEARRNLAEMAQRHHKEREEAAKTRHELGAELANARAIASGVTHHDECWRQSPEYARMKAQCDRLTNILAGETKEETAEKLLLVAKMNTRSVHILAEELWLAARAQKAVLTPKPSAPSRTAQTTHCSEEENQAGSASTPPPASSTE